MKLYQSLSNIRLLSNYSAKFMFVSFLGIHIPLFGVIGLLIYTSGPSVNKASCFLLTLGLTLLATTITLFILNGLVAPLKKTQRSVADYLDKKAIPNLPANMTDEMGILMRDINIAIKTLHTSLDEKDTLIKTLMQDVPANLTSILALTNLIRTEKDAEKINLYLNHIDQYANKQLTQANEIAPKYRD